MIPYFRISGYWISLEQYQDLRSVMSVERIEEFCAASFYEKPDEQQPLLVEIEYYEN